MTSPDISQTLLSSIENKSAKAGVIGLGYVGLPLAMTVAKAGFKVVGFDIDPAKITAIEAGRSYIEAVSDEVLASVRQDDGFVATSDFSRLAECDVIAICVPTPLTKYREPDLSYVEKTCRDIAAHLRKGQLVVLESTTYPGTTDGVVKTILESEASSPASISSSVFRPSGKIRAIAISRPRPFRRSSPVTAKLPES